MFATHTDRICSLKTALATLQDVHTMCAHTSKEDHDLLLARKEASISHEAAREAYIRHASRLGFLLQDIDTLLDTSFETSHGEEWTKNLKSGMDSKGALARSVQDEVAKWEREISRLQELEGTDGASSSYSDYSDSESADTYDGSRS
jgi:hypothetical protein